MLGGMEPATALGFTTMARGLGAAARRHGLVVPAFRSPPAVADVPRTLRRRADGFAVVAVRLRDRSSAEVAADMTDGLLLANRLSHSEAAKLRPLLLAAALGGVGAEAA